VDPNPLRGGDDRLPVGGPGQRHDRRTALHRPARRAPVGRHRVRWLGHDQRRRRRPVASGPPGRRPSTVGRRGGPGSAKPAGRGGRAGQGRCRCRDPRGGRSGADVRICGRHRTR
jgi:hypothetical protein